MKLDDGDLHFVLRTAVVRDRRPPTPLATISPRFRGVLLRAKIPRKNPCGTSITSPVGTSRTVPGSTVTLRRRRQIEARRAGARRRAAGLPGSSLRIRMFMDGLIELLRATPSFQPVEASPFRPMAIRSRNGLADTFCITVPGVLIEPQRMHHGVRDASASRISPVRRKSLWKEPERGRMRAARPGHVATVAVRQAAASEP